MAIRITKYVDVTSSVGAGITAPRRELIGRLFTTNPLVPTKTLLEFTNLDDIQTYFGSSSVEYKRAAFYFPWVSKNQLSPQKIGFARWTDEDQAPSIYGAPLELSLAALKLITNGVFSLTLGADTNMISGLDFSGAASLAAIAALIQTAIRDETGTMWTAATVTYNATSGGFDLVGGSEVAAVVSVAAGTGGTDISTSIGWLPQSVDGSSGAIWSDGALTETITETLTESADASDNFGSFLFIPTFTSDQDVEAATWNKAQGVKYQYCVRVPDITTAQEYCNLTDGLLLGMAGTGVTLSPIPTEFPEQAAMMILAATDYTLPNSVQNYMYQVFPGLTPSVTTNADANALDAINVNYYGMTQTAGQELAFYQDGILMGGSTDPRAMNVYANEQWLVDACIAACIATLLISGRVPANMAGVGQVIAVLQTVIDQGLLNGTISVNGILTEEQKAYITQISQDPKAWYQIQDQGYWVTARVVAYVESGVTKYKINFTLIYKKDDAIYKIDGRDILI